MALFLVVVLGIWGVLHTYVFWRLTGIAGVAALIGTRGLLALGALLWLSYPASRWLAPLVPAPVAAVLEFAAAAWVGVLFLLFAVLAIADFVTAGGLLWPQWAPTVRSAAVAVALVLAAIAQVQGLRPPQVSEHEVTLPGLPRERDGLTLVAVSDLHLGRLLGEGWLTARLEQIEAQRPDLVAIVGDTVDHEVAPLAAMLPALQRLRAPLGVWAVTGNHEHYAGVDRCVALFTAAGFRVLRNRASTVVDGLVLAGVDDLSVRPRTAESALANALAGRPPGATILLSHSPLQAEAAARAGVGLMLCGHTHNGQIWPFNYLVGLQFPYVTGRHQVGDLCLLVGRGSGTWGPRMRLWSRGEIQRIRLRSPPGP